jgi:hypothetical protein
VLWERHQRTSGPGNVAGASPGVGP